MGVIPSFYIKIKGFDGVSYCSALTSISYERLYNPNNKITKEGTGKCYAIFDYKKTKAINSKLVLSKKIIVEYEDFPDN